MGGGCRGRGGGGACVRARRCMDESVERCVVCVPFTIHEKKSFMHVITST